MSVSRLIPRARWRRLAALPVLGALVLVLAGCDRPTPLVTIQSGRNFVQAHAAQYDRDGAVIKDAGYQPPVLRAVPGDSVNIDVPKSVADNGYFLASNDTRISDIITVQHYRLTVPDGRGQVNLTIFQAPHGGSNGASGSWPFRLVVQP
ncbi:YgdI/YgdR family lipoprotein [Frankia sp. Cppng1_Ct_nod]|uniref:YgdI/YgdR family lipoprotein n=1 Tax=Frankia sp. Cppng1_Ct_nod TaxID=2897162 RepID=UPI001F5E7E29|nr:YgdI/YgdR family lipoprotein [Frankia sp. Cppng1_Ct_nod]